MDTLSLIHVLSRVQIDAAKMAEQVQARIREPRKKVSPEEYHRALEDLSWSLTVMSQMSGVVVSHAVHQEERLQALERANSPSWTGEPRSDGQPTGSRTIRQSFRRWLGRLGQK